MNLPNLLTLLRIFFVPLIVVALFQNDLSIAIGAMVVTNELIALGIFLIAAGTDMVDGYLARRWGQVTTVGTLLDPIADKLLTVSAFIALVELRLAPAWMVVVIVGREFAITGMRSIAAARGVVIAASPWGKLKTGTQVVAITLLILTNSLERWGRFGFLGVAVLWLVLVTALVSAIDYFVRFARTVDLAEGG